MSLDPDRFLLALSALAAVRSFPVTRSPTDIPDLDKRRWERFTSTLEGGTGILYSEDEEPGDRGSLSGFSEAASLINASFNEDELLIRFRTESSREFELRVPVDLLGYRQPPAGIEFDPAELAAESLLIWIQDVMPKHTVEELAGASIDAL